MQEEDGKLSSSNYKQNMSITITWQKEMGAESTLEIPTSYWGEMRWRWEILHFQQPLRLSKEKVIMDTSHLMLLILIQTLKRPA